MKVKKFYEPVLYTSVILVCGCSNDELEVWLKETKHTGYGELDPHHAACLIEFTQNHKEQFVIWVENIDGFYELVHETLHLVRRVFVNRGIPFDQYNDEMIAYHQSYWVKKLWRVMTRE